jgi:hypothetical protein
MNRLPDRVKARAGPSPRASFGGVSRQSPAEGALREAPGAFINDFISTYVPGLWDALVRTFGRTDVDYWLANDPATAQPLVLIWKEGAADEQVSPGRYSHAVIRFADLPRQPLKGDVVVKDGIEYDVVTVNAYAYDCCTVILQDRSEDVLR